jgi:hypothetical protein
VKDGIRMHPMSLMEKPIPFKRCPAAERGPATPLSHFIASMNFVSLLIPALSALMANVSINDDL